MLTPRFPRRLLPDGYAVEIVLDSQAPYGRLTTWKLTYPRFIHAELMTYRMWARNAASSRAIPAAEVRKRVATLPAMPVFWGQNQSGMQARKELPGNELQRHIDPEAARGYGPGRARSPIEFTRDRWLEARDAALAAFDALSDLSKVHPDWVDENGKGLALHKQLVNRLLEPFSSITTLVTGTDFENFFDQRDHEDAQPEFQVIATEMHHQYRKNKPQVVDAGDWHLPFISAEERPSSGMVEACLLASVGRCARISYNKADREDDYDRAIQRAVKLRDSKPGHWSPFEHVAQALREPRRIGPFLGWRTFRSMHADEAGPGSRSLLVGPGSEPAQAPIDAEASARALLRARDDNARYIAGLRDQVFALEAENVELKRQLEALSDLVTLARKVR